MKQEILVKTPIFSSVKNPVRLIGTAEGYIDPNEVCGIVSGVLIHPKVVDARNKENAKDILGGIFSLLLFRGGQQVLAMGTPKEMRKEINKVNSMDIEEEETTEVPE